MVDWEESALATAPKKPHANYRFLDDIRAVWIYSEEEFITFTDHLIAYQKTIQIKYMFDPIEVNFLDVVSYKGPEFLKTGFFLRPLNTGDTCTLSSGEYSKLLKGHGPS
ncbi:MAG: hypothetical protein ACRCZO_11550 [Cetobacterium sp.]